MIHSREVGGRVGEVGPADAGQEAAADTPRCQPVADRTPLRSSEGGCVPADTQAEPKLAQATQWPRQARPMRLPLLRTRPPSPEQGGGSKESTGIVVAMSSELSHSRAEVGVVSRHAPTHPACRQRVAPGG